MKHLIFLPLLVLLACRAPKDAGQELLRTYHPSAPVYAESGITFLSFRFQTMNDSLAFTHVSTIQSEGTLKKKDDPENPAAKYVIQLQSAQGDPMKDFFLSDPLKESMDVFSEDGTIQHGEIVHKEKVISLRFSKLAGDFTRAALYEVESPGKLRFVTSTACKNQ